MDHHDTLPVQTPRPAWWHYGTSAFGVLLYAIAFLGFADTLREGALYLGVIPAALTAAFFGVTPALLVTAACILVLQPILYLPFGYDVTRLFTTVVAVSGMTFSLATAVAVGVIRTLNLNLAALRKELSHLDRTDLLTNLLNRKALMETGDREMKRAVRAKNDVVYYLGRRASDNEPGEKAPDHKDRCTIDDYLGVFSCAVVDIDHFSRINEVYGSHMGDQVLRKLASLLTHEECLRESDVAGRLSGEEFLVLLTGTSSRNSLFPMERLRCRMEAHIFRDERGTTFNTTVSCGISQLRGDDESMDDLLRRAMAALHYAKEHGRNRVVVYEQELDGTEEDVAAS